jgi:hypothetical protein
MSAINSDEHDAEHGVWSGSEISRWRRSIATSQGRHRINRATRKNDEMM